MGKTKRNASRWMESRFKLGDTQYPEENETHYFNGRYQNKMRNGNRSYYALFIDPESIKVRRWRAYGNWAKAVAHREDDDWYDDHLMSFDFSYSDEAYEYAEQRRQEELEDYYLDYGYDPYMDWDY